MKKTGKYIFKKKKGKENYFIQMRMEPVDIILQTNIRFELTGKVYMKILFVIITRVYRNEFFFFWKK